MPRVLFGSRRSAVELPRLPLLCRVVQRDPRMLCRTPREEPLLQQIHSRQRKGQRKGKQVKGTDYFSLDDEFVVSLYENLLIRQFYQLDSK